MVTWSGANYAVLPPRAKATFFIFILRTIAMCCWTLLLTLPLIFFNMIGRSALPSVQLWSRGCLAIMGLKLDVQGKIDSRTQLIVGNHASWIDILVYLAIAPVKFVSKGEIKDWPVIGWLSKNAGTLFIERNPSKVREHGLQVKKSIQEGNILCIFPEATTSDGLRILPFRSSFFSVFVSENNLLTGWVQPVAIKYKPPSGRSLPDNYYSWWGNMNLLSHFQEVLSRGGNGRISVCIDKVIDASDFDNRKHLSSACQTRTEKIFSQI